MIEGNNIKLGGVNYSLEEQLIGTWIDGKPLYQKTIVLNNLTYRASTNLKTTECYLDIPNNVDFIFIENFIGQTPNYTNRYFYLGEDVGANIILSNKKFK